MKNGQDLGQQTGRKKAVQAEGATATKAQGRKMINMLGCLPRDQLNDWKLTDPSFCLLQGQGPAGSAWALLGPGERVTPRIRSQETVSLHNECHPLPQLFMVFTSFAPVNSFCSSSRQGGTAPGEAHC